MPPIDELLLTSEVSDILRIPQGTLRYWRSANQGPEGFRLGSRVVYSRSALEAWVSAQAQATTRGGVAKER